MTPIAQWVETYLIAALNYPTLVASKASRIVEVAGGRGLFDFGMRRAHGPQAGLLAARAAYLAGFAGTSLSPITAPTMSSAPTTTVATFTMVPIPIITGPIQSDVRRRWPARRGRWLPLR